MERFIKLASLHWLHFSEDSLVSNLRGDPVQELRNIPRVPPKKLRDRRSFRRKCVELLPDVPFEGKMHDGARLGNLLQRPQRCAQHRELTCSVLRRTQGEPKGVLDGRDARDTATHSQLRHHGERDSTEPGGLDLALNQSHGPAADRSDRNQHYRIHLFLPKPADNARNRVTQ